jgi:hypothetical protein
MHVRTACRTLHAIPVAAHILTDQIEHVLQSLLTEKLDPVVTPVQGSRAPKVMQCIIASGGESKAALPTSKSLVWHNNIRGFTVAYIS